MCAPVLIYHVFFLPFTRAWQVPSLLSLCVLHPGLQNHHLNHPTIHSLSPHRIRAQMIPSHSHLSRFVYIGSLGIFTQEHSVRTRVRSTVVLVHFDSVDNVKWITVDSRMDHSPAETQGSGVQFARGLDVVCFCVNATLSQTRKKMLLMINVAKRYW